MAVCILVWTKIGHLRPLFSPF
ncbi:hypothetical protein F383_19628 [Gossypium arboreum]|uniref:Uncharacterized protein n=1 Tax=Gossypium arboreum TaxID=29729 RepID=A0A0B0NLT0_GOSAR|nr:hypothetical protein F383_19628 [Gossypium arboreum]